MLEHPSTVPLDKLSRDPVNVRRTNKEATPDFVASIKTKGQIMPLVVRPDGKGGYYVTDGGKRLSAFQQLAKEKAIARDFPVKVDVREDSDLEARDTSLATAVIHHALHPVDKFEAFAQVAKDGLSAEEIAKRYGTTVKDVAKAMALGALAPEVREAWRDGKIAAEAAQCFTLEPDKKRQAEVLAKLAKNNNLWPGSVRQAIVGDKSGGARYVRYVGREAYVAAGGKIHEDLFGESDIVSDPQLAKRLADEKLKEKCAELIADGWAWAAPKEDLPDGMWQWARLKVPKDKYPAEEKAKRGVVLELTHNGTLNIDYGVEKPSKAPAATGRMAKELSPKKSAAAGVISNSLMQRMSEWLTSAAQRALPTDVDLALAALCAGFASGDVVKVEENGHSDESKGGLRISSKGAFDRLLDQFRKQSRDANLAHLAKVAGVAVDMVVSHASKPPLKNKDHAALCAAIPAKAMNAALRETFNARDYFDSVSKPMVLAAIAEAVNEDEARRLQGKPKGDVAKFALANAPKTGWLPKELRTANYDGPGKDKKKPKAAKKAKPAPAKKAAAKKKAKV